MVAEAIRQFGDDVAGDLHEFWRRMVFSLLPSNFDDHLRNHRFLLGRPGRWSLSHYDFNPLPEIERSSMNKIPITEEGGAPSIASAMAAATRFGLKPVDAKRTLHEVFDTVRQWRKLGQGLHIKAGTLNAYASALENGCGAAHQETFGMAACEVSNG